MEIGQTGQVFEEYCSGFGQKVDEHTITKSLYNSNGKCGEIGVSASRGTIIKCKFTKEKYRHPVPVTFKCGRPNSIVVDLDVMCLRNDEKGNVNFYGIVVAANAAEEYEPAQEGELLTKKEKAAMEEKERPFNVVELHVLNAQGGFQHARTIKVYGQITCMRVLISPIDMPDQRQFLSSQLGKWPCLVAVGCEKSSCFIAPFSDFDINNREHMTKGVVNITEATTDAIKALTDKKTGRFRYTMADNNCYEFHKKDACVTAVTYIPCYALIVVGLSNGCIVLIPLDGKSSISCLAVPCATPINFLVVLEPEYDPEGGFYIFSARERHRNREQTKLAVFSHKLSRKPDPNDGSYEYFSMSTVLIPMKDGARWINVHGVVTKRKRRETEASNDTTAENSQLPLGLDTSQHMHHDGLDRTRLFYTYLALGGEVKGGLFDLNAFYSRRCGPTHVKFDEFGQDPICSSFTLDIPMERMGKPLFSPRNVSNVICTDISRYSTTIFDREPLFHPMAAHLTLQVYTYGRYGYAAFVNTLQLTVLDKITESLASAFAQSDKTIAYLERVGLVLAPTTRKERLRMEERPINERVPTDLDKICRALVADESFRIHLIPLIDNSTDRKQQLHLGRWMFSEMREMVMRLDEAIAPFFYGVTLKQLSRDAYEMYNYLPDFFKFAELFFWKLRRRGMELFNDTPKLRYTRKLHAMMAFELRLFLSSVNWFISCLPIHASWTDDLLEAAEAVNKERRERAARTGYPMYLDALLERLYSATMEDALWRNEADPKQWYPPPRFELLSVLRQNESALEDRTALVLYFLMDVDEAIKRDHALPKAERRNFHHSVNSVVRMRDVGELTQFYFAYQKELLVDRDALAGVRERWESDMKGTSPNQKENRRMSGMGGEPEVSNLTEEEEEEAKMLLGQYKRYRFLQKVDEDRLRELFNKQGHGEYRWHLFLIKKARFPEVADLPVPSGPPYPHWSVAEYAKYKEMALYQKSQLPPPTYSYAYAAKEVFSRTAPEPEPAPLPRIMKVDNITIRGKTPKKLNIFKRLATAGPPAGALDHHSIASISTPTGASPAATAANVARINALLRTPAMKFGNQNRDDEETFEERERRDRSEALDEMARVREVMRTPRSRHAARAVAGDATPEDVQRPALPAPTSILKSAHKESRLGPQTPKSRLRFAAVFEEKSITPRETTMASVADSSPSSNGSSVQQPNFDESFEEPPGGSAESIDDAHSPSIHNMSVSSGLSTTTRLEREIEEAERSRLTDRRVEEPDEPSLELGVPMGDEEMREEEEDASAGGNDAVAPAIATRAVGNATFDVYHDSEGDARSTDDEREVAFDEASGAASADDDDAAAGDLVQPTKTPPPTPAEEDEEEEASEVPPAAAVGDDGENNANLSRAVTPVDGQEEEEETQRSASPIVERAASGAASSSAAMPSDDLNETFTVSDATFVIDVRAVGADDALLPPVIEEEEEREEEKEAEVVAPPADAAVEEEAAAERGERAEPARAESHDAGDGNLEEEREEPEEEEEEETEEKVEEQERRPAATPAVEMEEEEREEEKEEEETPAPATSRAAAPPPIKPRTVFPDRTLPLSLGLRSYVYMENGIEKSYEEQSGDEEEEEEDDGGKKADILAALSPRRRSSSRLQRTTASRGRNEEKEEEHEAAPATPATATTTTASKGKKRLSSRTEESAQDVAGPSTSKRDRREEEEGDDDGESDGHLFTTTRTSIIEERVVTREDGVVQHTVKQSTKVIETADGVVVAEDQEDKETIEEEGDREEQDDADRATPPMVEAAAEPGTGRRSSRVAAAANRSRTVSTASRTSTKAMEDEEKRKEKATTPIREPVRAAGRRKLLVRAEEDDEQEEKKDEEEEAEKRPEEPTPRRSSRGRKASETSASSAVSQTPSKSTAKSAARASRTPSREPSAAPVDAITPSKRGRARKEPEPTASTSLRARKASESSASSAVSQSPSRRQSARTARTPSREPSAAPTDAITPSKRGRARKEPEPTASTSLRARKASESSASSAVSQSPSRRQSARTARTPSREPSAAPMDAITPSKRGRPARKETKESESDAPSAPVPVAAKRTTAAKTQANITTRRARATSESVQAQKKKEEGDEGGEQKKEGEDDDEVDHVALLRQERDRVRAKRLAREEAMAKRKSRAQLAVIPEKSAVTASVDGDDQPGTSQATAASTGGRRKRSQSETVTKEPVLKTPAKKKAKGSEKDDEEEAPADQSMLRRSTRKASVTAAEAPKTPSKSAKAKQ